MGQENNQADIAIEGLCKSFGPQRVLNGFNLNVAHGETVAVLGRSGTGKSVLLKLLIGLQKPDSGCIRIQGQEIATLEITLSVEERKKLTRELLGSVGMEHDVDKMPSEISGGMQKRVGLARGLALGPAIVLLDEPTAGLDPITAAEIGVLISQLQEKHKMTSLVVTHDLHGAKHFANRLVMLDQGKVLFEGSFEELQKSTDPFVIQYLKDAA
jgi:phospholipid/cholesterol/gamma-HCH transport system ATP-binding protein